MTINSQQKFGIKTTRKEPNMTQVTLEHREPISFGPMSIQFTKFDTDDKQFENEANELRQKSVTGVFVQEKPQLRLLRC